MDRETLRKLEMLNQLSLTEAQKDEVIDFFAKRDSELDIINKIDTENTERMVHVMPVLTVVREDVASQPFSRDDLQKGAPETDEGYWCVPKVME
ncbi:MAG: Asp-tRNA(Asn)/Glu-tRNA(Gln) amidotransferase subunit GatC [Ruminococcaceae bacterium]|nr:Asp-tRNA(Asn)/Glu-tRNA(Gln) amidotransferase subunit GatC [Oscillospiraceae bacterium]